MRAEQVTTVDLLRHGACEGGDIFRGSTDVALSPRGWEQMYSMATVMTEGSGIPQQLFSSPLRRCQVFAAEFSARHGVPCEVVEDLREIHFGSWEGRPISVVAGEGDQLQRFFSDPVANPPPEGEPMPVFSARVISALRDLIIRHRGQHLMVITHGAVIRLLMCHWLGMPLSAMSRVAVPYAGGSRFRVYHRDGDNDWVQLCQHWGEQDEQA